MPEPPHRYQAELVCPGGGMRGYECWDSPIPEVRCKSPPECEAVPELRTPSPTSPGAEQQVANHSWSLHGAEQDCGERQAPGPGSAGSRGLLKTESRTETLRKPLRHLRPQRKHRLTAAHPWRMRGLWYTEGNWTKTKLKCSSTTDYGDIFPTLKPDGCVSVQGTNTTDLCLHCFFYT